MTQRGQNLLVLASIVGVFVAFALAGRLFVDPSEMDRTNQGTLIVPHVPVERLQLTTTDNEDWTSKDMNGQWSLIYIAGERCQRGCKNALYYLMTQLRRSLAEDAERLRLVLVHTAPPSEQLRTFMDNKLSDMVELRGETATVTKALAPAFEAADRNPRHHLYLAAPDGQIFMWYPTHEDKPALLDEADGIYSDLERTLKGSRI